MILSADIAAIHRRFRTIGAALGRVNLNNTHSGNMSLRNPQDPGLFYVTASGSQCGAMAPGDIVSVRFSDLGWEGTARPSSETNTHRRVLSLPGVDACVHCHSLVSTLVSFDSPEQPVLLTRLAPEHDGDTRYFFQPMDFFGAGLLGTVPVGIYRNPVGSAEMEERIPRCLGERPVTIVAGHGPFARGRSLAECLQTLSVLENSAALRLALQRRGTATAGIQAALRSKGVEAVFACRPRTSEALGPAGLPADDPALAADFTRWLTYNFNFGLGAYGTGSMSRKLGADEMVFCPMSAAPEGVEVPLYRIPLRAAESEATDVRLHRLIYTHTPFTACMVTTSPMATAEGMAAMAETHGPAALLGRPAGIDYTAGHYPIVVPIDAEAQYYDNRLPVADPASIAADSPGNPIPNLLGRHRGSCIVAGYGLIAAGRTGLDQAAYIVSAAERSARFRQEVHLHSRLWGGPPPTAFEPE
ncbi:MAG: class II aldolase/adducin family protein [Deltaproteobacteria bacterium]|nr:class II aldolase/adducin family protein [Deltaproteobacteria bacterium]